MCAANAGSGHRRVHRGAADDRAAGLRELRPATLSDDSGCSSSRRSSERRAVRPPSATSIGVDFQIFAARARSCSRTSCAASITAMPVA